MKYLLFALLLLSPGVYSDESLPPGCSVPDPFPLVYTRQPRYDKPIIDKGGKVLFESGAQWQDFYDGGQPDMFSESDIILDDMAGSRKVLFNCTTRNRICAAHDARVSPDATRILYTVARADRFTTINHIPDLNFKATSYDLWLYTVSTGKSVLVERNARMGGWTGNGSIVFASNRAGEYPPWAVAGPDYPEMGLHIFTAELKGHEVGPAFDVTPHAASCLSPAVNPDGTITMSCWNGYGERGYAKTPLNMYWIDQCNGNGTDCKTILGAHGSGYWRTREYLADVCEPGRCGEGSSDFRVLRGYVPLRDNRYAVTNYYRTNHTGELGAILNCERNAAEGYLYSADVPELTFPSKTPGSGRFVPQCYMATPFGNDADNLVKMHKNGRAMGKTGYPFPVPQTKGVYGFTMARGNCYSPAPPELAKRSAFGGEYTCKKQINVARVDRVTDPFDLDQTYCIAGCQGKWNAFGARYLAPYKVLYGQAEPDPAPEILKGKTTTLNIVDARAGEIFKVTDNHKPYKDCSLQGCADPDWAARISHIHIEQILPHKTRPKGKGFFATQPIGKFPILKDGSLSITMRCAMTYQLWGEDEYGATVAKDNTLHSAVCGEVVTCQGCHDGHSESRAKELGSAEERFKKTEAAQVSLGAE